MAPPILSLAVGGPPPVSSCPLLDLPAELILSIAHPLTPKALSHFMRTCHSLRRILASPLYSMLIERKDVVLSTACLQNNTTKLRVAVAAGARPTTRHLLSACGSQATAAAIVLLDEYALPANYVSHHNHPGHTPTLHTPLDIATRSFDLATVEALLARGAVLRPPSTVYPPGHPFDFDPMCFAMLHARGLLAPFVERGYHLEDRFYCTTALGLAVRFGCVDTVKLLLKHGSDVNQRQLNGMTPLHECLRKRRNLEMLTLLLEAGADVDTHNWTNESSLQIAMCRGDVEAVRLLVKGTKRSVHPMCWFPVRCRHPEWLRGRLECWRILKEAGIYSSEEDINNLRARHWLEQEEKVSGIEKVGCSVEIERPMLPIGITYERLDYGKKGQDE